MEQPARGAVAMQCGGSGWSLATSSVLAPAEVGAWPQHSERPQRDRVPLRGRKGLQPPGFFPLPKPSPGPSSHRMQPLAERPRFQNGVAGSRHLAVAGCERAPPHARAAELGCARCCSVQAAGGSERAALWSGSFHPPCT